MDRKPPDGLNFHTVFASAPTQLMIMDRQLVIVYANEAYLRTTMRTLSDIQGRYVFDAFPEAPERTALFKAAFERALAGEENVLRTEPFSVPAPEEEGGVREIVWTCTHVPVANDAGEIAFVLQNAVDVTAEHALHRHNEMLLQELNHRVKNSLATAQVIAQRSLIDSKTMAEARDDFVARLHAMAAIHDLLVAKSWSGAELGAVLRQTLQPFDGGSPVRHGITLQGPPVPLTVKQAQTMSMAIHELATNATKYGALSHASGAIDIAWSHDPSADGAFRLSWKERNGPAVSPPGKKGFGTIMLTGVLAQEIGGTITLDYPTHGVICLMEGRIGP
ncbi:sensor histidine kinase [Marinimicrococcus flavescens]|uniref:histidine kinase n=1 Tax=Marinimicrococcus flavescens TaxID=3031815 RepID=A0AAP3XT71_9PROT|nr:HWE histidine kinase domain-containing protein [Marinimicrococcus flavescens]